MIDTNSEKIVQSLRSGLPGEELRFLLLIMLVVLGLTPVINTMNETIVRHDRTSRQPVIGVTDW